MALKRCEHGHYFEASRHSTCPSCGISGISDHLYTRPAADLAAAAPGADEGDAKTRPGPIDGGTGIDPVVGWLVCIEGPERGQDYRIRSERNFIGRGEGMDIRIRGDERISRERHAAVTFNPKNHQFKIHPGESRGLVYLNSMDVDAPVLLQAGDIVELGKTRLLFVPLCGDTFRWT
jgi:FHA domain